jgi:transcriptional regulator with XRE-family HTH domain
VRATLPRGTMSISYNEIVGRVIRMRRELAGISLRDMADKTGFTSVSGWSRIETGDSPLTIGKLRVVARALNLAPWQLVQAADDLAITYAVD